MLLGGQPELLEQVDALVHFGTNDPLLFALLEDVVDEPLGVDLDGARRAVACHIETVASSVPGCEAASEGG